MFISNHLIGFGAVEKNSVLFDRTLGTNIGNMTQSGGLASIFDGNTNQDNTASGWHNVSPAYAGKTLAAKAAVDRVVTYGCNNFGYSSGANGTITLTLYGKNGSVPASATDGTSLGSTSFTDTDVANSKTIISNDNGTEYDHVWVSNAGVTNLFFAELQFYLMQ